MGKLGRRSHRGPRAKQAIDPAGAKAWAAKLLADGVGHVLDNLTSCCSDVIMGAERWGGRGRDAG